MIKIQKLEAANGIIENCELVSVVQRKLIITCNNLLILDIHANLKKITLAVSAHEIPLLIYKIRNLL